MKSIFFLSILCISSVAYAQQPGIRPFDADTANILSYRYNPLDHDLFLMLQRPTIKMDDDFYTILQAPNVDHRYTKGSLLIKRPEFIPEMPVDPLKPFSDFYLLDLDTEIILAEEQ